MKKKLVHLLLFIITFIFATFSGAEWMFGNSFIFSSAPMGMTEFLAGMYYSIPFLSILTAHEFGHYFMAKYYRLKVTLPFYIPVWFIGLAPSIGTMGAFIQIKSPLRSRQEFFDVGIAGPLAGFMIALVVLFYGFTHLPPPEFIFQIHPEYAEYGLNYAEHVYDGLPPGSITMGSNLLFEFFKEYVVSDPSRIPNPYEIIHYPFLLAGFLACFFTALNLIPIGQLDGGHILYGLIGYKRHKNISATFFVLFIFFGGLGLFSTVDFYQDFKSSLFSGLLYLGFLYFVFERLSKDRRTVMTIALSVFLMQLIINGLFPTIEGYYGWLVFGMVIGRFLGVYHPPALYDEPLNMTRKIIGWLSLVIFIICFSPTPFIFI